MISWKYTFKRLNEEYELANKKKQALDNLCATGKISQLTRDSFTSDIVKAIEDIEKQRQDLAEKMQAKTQEIDGQIKTLEMLLANYEIQHVVGEIDDDIYEREITLLSTSLETSRNELSVLKDATNQLFPSPKPIEAPASIQAEEQAESTPLDVAIETPTIEPTLIETATTEPTSIEIASIEAPLETMQAETAQIQEAPIETPIIEEASMEAPVMDEAPVEEAQFTPAEVEMVNEAAPEEVMAEPVVEEATVNMEEASPMQEPVAEAQVEIETSPSEVSIQTATTEDTPVETAPETQVEVAEIETPTETVVECAFIETPQEETAPIDAPIEDAPEEMTIECAQPEEVITEAAPIDSQVETEDTMVEEASLEAPVEEAQFTPAEVEMVNEAAPEEVMAEPVVEEATVNMEEASPMQEPVAEAQVEIETSPEEVANAEIAPDPTVAVPLQSFEVTEHSPMDMTLEKIMEQTIEEQVNQPVIVEEAHIQTHPLEAPQQAPSEEILDADTATDQTPQTDENEEDTTE